MTAIKPHRAGKETRTPSGWRGWIQEETLEGAGHSGSGGEPAPLKGLQELTRITQTAPADHNAASLPPSFSSFLCSPPCPSSHATRRAMVLMGFHRCSVLHVGPEPRETTQPRNLVPAPSSHPGHTLTWSCRKVSPAPRSPHLPTLWKAQGIHKKTNSPPDSRDDRSNPCFFRATRRRDKHRPILFISLKLNPMAHLPGDFRLNGLRNSNKLFNPVK